MHITDSHYRLARVCGSDHCFNVQDQEPRTEQRNIPEPQTKNQEPWTKNQEQSQRQEPRTRNPEPRTRNPTKNEEPRTSTREPTTGRQPETKIRAPGVTGCRNVYFTAIAIRKKRSEAMQTCDQSDSQSERAPCPSMGCNMYMYIYIYTLLPKYKPTIWDYLGWVSLEVRYPEIQW